MFSVTSGIICNDVASTVRLTVSFMNVAVAKQLNTVGIDREYKCTLRLPRKETLDMDHFCTIKTIILIHIGHVAG